MVDLLGGLSPYFNSFAYAINNSGQVTGLANNTANGVGAPAFRYNLFANTLSNLGALGINIAWGRSINNGGQVAGYSYLSDGFTQRAFLYSNSIMTDLGALGGNFSWAYGMNNNGEVVGVARTSLGVDHAFLYSGGVMQDLNDLLPLDSGWVLTHAADINDAGIVVGAGTVNGETHAYMMVPGC